MRDTIATFAMLVSGCVIAFFYDTNIQSNGDLIILIISVTIFFSCFAYSTSDTGAGDDDAK